MEAPGDGLLAKVKPHLKNASTHCLPMFFVSDKVSSQSPPNQWNMCKLLLSWLTCHSGKFLALIV